MSTGTTGFVFNESLGSASASSSTFPSSGSSSGSATRRDSVDCDALMPPPSAAAAGRTPVPKVDASGKPMFSPGNFLVPQESPAEPRYAPAPPKDPDDSYSDLVRMFLSACVRSGQADECYGRRQHQLVRLAAVLACR